MKISYKYKIRKLYKMGQYTLVLNACKASRTVGGELGTVKKNEGLS